MHRSALQVPGIQFGTLQKNSADCTTYRCAVMCQATDTKHKKKNKPEGSGRFHRVVEYYYDTYMNSVAQQCNSSPSLRNLHPLAIAMLAITAVLPTT